jgi:molybdopterin-containing oxidoreductase family membrane subunit
MSFQEITEDIVERQRSAGSRFRIVAGVLAALLALGVVGFALRLADGFDDRTIWGYHAAIFAYLFVTAQSAVLVSVALRMAKAHWRRPLSRVSELFAVVGVFNFLLYIPLLWALPITDGRRSIWFEWPGHSPHLWDTIAMGLLVVLGLALLYFAALPDLATIRDHSSGKRHGIYRRLALSWHGTPKQWKVLQMGVSVLGGFYFMFLIFVHMLISIDFAMSLIPGWKDAIFPTFHAISGLQSGVATIIVTMFILRWVGGLKGYLEVEQFWGLSKLLLALCLLWFYFWWAGFFTYWYGRTPAEQSVLKLLMFESYKLPFFLAWAFCFPIPFVILMWNVIRKTTWGPALAALFVLVGSFFNMVRIYVPAYSIEDIKAHALEVAPPVNTPGLPDVLIVVGALAGAALVYMLATRLFPITSIWEIKEGRMLQRVRTLLKTQVRVLAKPE